LCIASSVQGFNQKHEVKHLGETNLTTLFLTAKNMTIKMPATHAAISAWGII